MLDAKKKPSHSNTTSDYKIPKKPSHNRTLIPLSSYSDEVPESDTFKFRKLGIVPGEKWDKIRLPITEDQLILDDCSVESYGEVFQKLYKPKIQKRQFQDQVKQLTSNEMKNNQISPPLLNNKQKICPHNNTLSILQNPGLKVGKQLSLLYNFTKDHLPASICKHCQIMNKGEEQATLVTTKPKSPHEKGELSIELRLGTDDRLSSSTQPGDTVLPTIFKGKLQDLNVLRSNFEGEKKQISINFCVFQAFLFFRQADGRPKIRNW